MGNHTTCDAGWAKCPTPSDGKEAVDRRAIDLEMEELVKQVYAADPKTAMVLVASFPFAINWSQANLPAILHMTHNAQEMGDGHCGRAFRRLQSRRPAGPDLAEIARPGAR